MYQTTRQAALLNRFDATTETVVNQLRTLKVMSADSSRRTSEKMCDARGAKRAVRYVDESSGRVRVELHRRNGTVFFVDYFDHQRRFSVRKFVCEGRGAAPTMRRWIFS